jgi:hypothetical protein
MKENMNTAKAMVSLIMSTAWIAGMVIAQGWLKIIAIVFPPYAWYLLIEKLMKFYGII